MKFIAYSIKGLEHVAKQDILTNIKNVKILETGDKYIVFEAKLENININYLRTIDDIGLLVCRFNKPKTLTEEKLSNQVANADLDFFLEKLQTFRQLKNTFCVTLSIAGLRIKKSELENNLIKLFTNKFKLVFTKKDHTNIDFRVFLNRKVGFLSIRLTKEPLYKREYKQYSSLGSLKPTIAAGLVKLVFVSKFPKEYKQPPLKLVDNFCGSGTILCEAKILGFEVFGGDIEKENVLNTQKNLSNLKFKNIQQIKPLNATNTKLQSSYFDYAVSNLP